MGFLSVEQDGGARGRHRSSGSLDRWPVVGSVEVVGPPELGGAAGVARYTRITSGPSAA